MVFALAFQPTFSGAAISCSQKLARNVLGYWGINGARPQSLPRELNMTKSPTHDSPPLTNEELRQHRNVYDCDGEYEFPTAQHWTAPEAQDSRGGFGH